MEKRIEPLVTDKWISDRGAAQGDASMAVNREDFAAGERARGYINGGVDVKLLYEADRAKTLAFMQVLVDAMSEAEALAGAGRPDIGIATKMRLIADRMRLVTTTLSRAKEEFGIEPTNEQKL